MELTSRLTVHDEPAVQPQTFGIGELFWTIREAVIIADASTRRILLWNPAAEEMFGYTAAEACQRTVDVLVPPQLKARHRAGLARFNATGEGEIIGSRRVIEQSA